ncbi:MAG: hypothetical protein AB8F74_03595 [Saprospiraceae bacterium]
MKKTKSNIDQLKALSTSVIEKDQQAKVKGGVDKSKIRIPGSTKN